MEKINKNNDELVKAIKSEVEYMVSRTDDDINSKLALQNKLTDLLIVLRNENHRDD